MIDSPVNRKFKLKPLLNLPGRERLLSVTSSRQWLTDDTRVQLNTHGLESQIKTGKRRNVPLVCCRCPRALRAGSILDRGRLSHASGPQILLLLLLLTWIINSCTVRSPIKPLDSHANDTFNTKFFYFPALPPSHIDLLYFSFSGRGQYLSIYLKGGFIASVH